MKKKLGFLITSCMSVSALPLFAAACKNENKQIKEDEAEVDVNTLFKISLPKNTDKKPSELKPEDIVVEILNNDISVEIQKVEYKEGKGVLVSYLATNTKTNKIVDEKTITLEVTTEKEQVEPKKDKKYDDLVTVSVEESKKNKVADEVTKEDIIVSKPEGETFEATVESVSVPKKQLDSVNVKIKVVDGKTEKTITKTISGFKEATPKAVEEGYLIFKDLEIVNTNKAKKWLKEAEDGTIVYYDFNTTKFMTKKFDKSKKEDPDRFDIFSIKKSPKWGIETAAPDGTIEDGNYKATAQIVKKADKIAIKFRISQLIDPKTKTIKYFEKVETSNFLDIPVATMAENERPSENAGNSAQTDPINKKTDGSINGEPSDQNIKNEELNNLSKNLLVPELYEPSVEKNLFAVEKDADKVGIKKMLDKAISTSDSAIRIDGGTIKVRKSKENIKGLAFNPKLNKILSKIKTHTSSASIGFKLKSGKGIKVEKIMDNKYKFSWYLIDKQGQPTSQIFMQELDLS
ncbi:hypothetical protein [Mycoplasmopsis bovigenitalium]|uniref:hypothetical protein n=1 Tax=Mycoplasmopsis bovigenitalium TaxID=2112 RepID=UPI000BBA7F2F|nr:hypothetical protein [Mycoplasmopsis bovigenitalium]